MRADLPILASALALLLTPAAVGKEVVPVDSGGLVAQIAPHVRAKGRISGGGWSADLYLLIERDEAMIVAIEDGRPAGAMPIATSDEVLRVLADRRLEFMWSALTDWAGNDLEKMRVRAVETATQRALANQPLPPRSAVESSVRPSTRALMQRADALVQAGRREEGIALLRRSVEAGPGKSDWQQAEFVMITLRISALLSTGEQLPEAIALLEAAEAKLPRSQYTLNFHMTLANYLTRVGQHARALAILDKTEAEFGAAKPKKRAQSHVPGSDRMFALIRSCAMRGLGRAAEAERELAKIMGAGEPRDDVWILVNNATVTYSALLCTGDVDRIAAFVARRLDAPQIADGMLVQLQPAYASPSTYRHAIEAVRAHPDVRAAVARRMRVLPAELEPALNRRPAAQ